MSLVKEIISVLWEAEEKDEGCDKESGGSLCFPSFQIYWDECIAIVEVGKITRLGRKSGLK